MLKVFIAAVGGTLLGAYVEPKVTPHLPAQLQGANVAKFVHAGISGATTVGIWYVIKGA
jgi:hypothetical protein